MVRAKIVTMAQTVTSAMAKWFGTAMAGIIFQVETI